VGQPDEKARKEIFKIHMRDMPIAKDVDVSELAEMSDGYAGADIEALCREAAMVALREDRDAKEVRREHFMKAFETVRPSIDEEMIDYYKEIAKKLGKVITKKEIVKGMEVM